MRKTNDGQRKAERQGSRRTDNHSAPSTDQILFFFGSFPLMSLLQTACTTALSEHLQCMTDELIRGEEQDNQLTAARRALDGKLMAAFTGIVVRQRKERALTNVPDRDGLRSGSSRQLRNHQIHV